MSPDPSAAEIGARLLAHLRRMDGMHSVEYAEAPSPVSGGFETLTFKFKLAHAPPPFDAPLILRQFREADASPRARFEAAVNGAVASLGYPAPAVRAWSPDVSVLGGAFLILERLPGANLFTSPLDPALFRFPALLADAQQRLHALPPAPVVRAFESAGFGAARLHPDAEVAELSAGVSALGLAGLEPGAAWLRSRRPPDSPDPVVCHGDFHPFNVLASDGRITGVVDWTLRHMKLADPAYDVGATLVLLSHAPAQVPWILRAVAARVRRRLVRAYLEHYRSRRALVASKLDYYEALRLLGCLAEAGEHRLADLGRAARPAKPTAFGDPRVQEGMLARFRELTGVALRLSSARVGRAPCARPSGSSGSPT